MIFRGAPVLDGWGGGEGQSMYIDAHSHIQYRIIYGYCSSAVHLVNIHIIK